MIEQRKAQMGDYADWYPLPEFIASQCSSGFDGPDSYTFGTLTPETTYYVYAFWVDEQTGFGYGIQRITLQDRKTGDFGCRG